MGSAENLVFTNVLGGVCRSRREGQTGEDFHQEIFELRQMSMRRFPSGNLRVNPRHCGTPKNCLRTIFFESAPTCVMVDIPLCDISRKPIQHCTHFKCVIGDFYRTKL